LAAIGLDFLQKDASVLRGILEAAIPEDVADLSLCPR
jgi:hypothetical protein